MPTHKSSDYKLSAVKYYLSHYLAFVRSSFFNGSIFRG